DAEPAVILEGIQAVREQALAILAQLGFPRHTEPGARFDPHQHDAVAVVPAAAPPGTVADVIRPGYGTGRQQLRPASVVVAKESDGDHTWLLRGAGSAADGQPGGDPARVPEAGPGLPP